MWGDLLLADMLPQEESRLFLSDGRKEMQMEPKKLQMLILLKLKKVQSLILFIFPPLHCGLVEEVFVAEEAVEITTFKVGLAIVQGPGADVLLTIASKALGAVGIVNVVAGTVPYGSVLPYAAQQLIKSTDAVLALDIVSHDQIGCGLGSASAVLSSALYQVGVAAEKPVVPGIVCQASLLEAKGVLPNLCAEWAGAILGMLNISSDRNFGKVPAPAVPPPSPPTPDINDTQVLLTKFRETLKVLPPLRSLSLSPVHSLCLVPWCHRNLWFTEKVQNYG
jgi:hypothetical protein